MENHFTAWISITPEVLENDFCDVVVLRDEIAGYREDSEGNEVPEWTSTGDGEVFEAQLSIRHDEDDKYDHVIDEAETELSDAGWSVTGEWESIGTGYLATVTKD